MIIEKFLKRYRLIDYHSIKLNHCCIHLVFKRNVLNTKYVIICIVANTIL